VLVANSGNTTQLQDASEHLGRYIGTVRVVAEIFSEQFFAPVGSGKARVDRYLRNREFPNSILIV
jgi:hypothetical protein